MPGAALLLNNINVAVAAANVPAVRQQIPPSWWDQPSLIPLGRKAASFVGQDVVLFVRPRPPDGWWDAASFVQWQPDRPTANTPSVDKPPPMRRDFARGWWDQAPAPQRGAAIASLLVIIAPTTFVPAGRPVNLYTLIQGWKDYAPPVVRQFFVSENPVPPVPFVIPPVTKDTIGVGAVWGQLGRDLTGRTVIMRATSWATGAVKEYPATVMVPGLGIVRASWAGRSPAADGWRIEWLVR